MKSQIIPNYTDLSLLSSSSLVSELADSQSCLSGAGLFPVDTLIYPYGKRNSSTDQAAIDVWFIWARTDNRGYNSKDTNKFALFGQTVQKETSLTQLKNWIDTAYNDKTWTILIFHKINTTWEAYSFDTNTFSELIDYIVAKNINMVTIHEGITQMN